MLVCASKSRGDTERAENQKRTKYILSKSSICWPLPHRKCKHTHSDTTVYSPCSKSRKMTKRKLNLALNLADKIVAKKAKPIDFDHFVIVKYRDFSAVLILWWIKMKIIKSRTTVRFKINQKYTFSKQTVSAFDLIVYRAVPVHTLGHTCMAYAPNGASARATMTATTRKCKTKVQIGVAFVLQRIFINHFFCATTKIHPPNDERDENRKYLDI